ncbi:ribosome-inactivating family protein [Streptomyces brasiliscabiei]|uniref:ribosome-inactivating family protein n=1 Tax=Streptomyces brasiliscabiei TaxID=2736302 RepID=UPI001C116228|nr:ribosome-inactivating family protein [Streptomyces brasiliscabiei]
MNHLPFRRLAASVALPTLLAGAVLAGGVAAPSHSAGKPVTIQAQNVGKEQVTNDTSGPIDLTITDSGPSTQRAYNAVINQIRQRVADTRTYRGQDGRTYSRSHLVNGVIAERPSNATADYFAVHLQARPGTSQISLVLNASNLYVVGFYDHGSRIYYRLGDSGPVNPIGSGVRQTNSAYINSGHYQDLTRMANEQRGVFDRADQAIGLTSIRQAIDTLRDSHTSRAQDAGALTLLITSFAEAARFDYISYRIQQAIGGGWTWNLGETGVALTNSWSSLSSYLRSRADDGASFVFHIGRTMVLYTVADIARQLAVAYMASTWNYSTPK